MTQRDNLAEELGEFIDFTDPSQSAHIVFSEAHRIMKTADAQEDELRDIFHLYAEFARDYVSPFDSIEKLLKATFDNDGFVVRKITNTRTGLHYIAYMNGFSGNTDGFIVSEKDRKLVAQICDTAICQPELETA